jgi:cytoskeletal protein CcmA (bactofilin family)
MPMPPRPGEAMRHLADLTYQPKPDRERSCLSVVGRGITLSGEVNSCDKLVIEGSVDAKLTNCRAIEIAKSGLFKGSTSIDEAEIRGRFEGDLVVRNRLLIKATGRVSGTIRYGQIEIEYGGQIFGDIQAHPAGELGNARRNELAKTVDDLAVYTEKDRALAGVIVTIGDDGEFRLHDRLGLQPKHYNAHGVVVVTHEQPGAGLLQVFDAVTREGGRAVADAIFGNM